MHHFPVLWQVAPLYFGSNIIYFWKKQHMKVQIFRYATARIKIYQILHVIFGTKSQFFFKLCITLQCHKTQLFCTFSSKTLYTLDKRSPSKCIFWLSAARMKLNQITSFFNPRVSSPRVSSPFSVMTNNSYKCSSWNIICFGQKEPIKVQFCRLLSALMKVHPLPHASCHFWN